MNYDELEKNREKIKDYDKLMRHLRRKVKITLENEEGQKDDFEFYPASFETYAKFMSLATMMEDKKVDPEVGKKMLEVMAFVVKESYPDWPDEVCNQFVANNFSSMFEIMEKIMPEKPSDVERIKRIQKQYNRLKGANEPNRSAEDKTAE